MQDDGPYDAPEPRAKRASVGRVHIVAESEGEWASRREEAAGPAWHNQLRYLSRVRRWRLARRRSRSGIPPER